MNSPLAKLLAKRSGAKLDPQGRKAVELFRSAGVRSSAELQRIKRLPRRRLAEEDLSALAADMTAELKLPEGTMNLRPLQAASLRDLHDYEGAMASLRVGGGKTLVTYLAPVVVSAQRTLVVVPATLREKTLRDYQVLSKHWKNPENVRVLSYEMLSRADRESEINNFAPDFMIFDECHKLKSRKAAATRRVGRYLKANPSTRCLFLSGTITKRSLEDFSHILVWTLGEERSPLPTRYDELFEWALAVDEKLPSTRTRVAPGALSELYDASEVAEARTDALRATRKAVGRRIEETPGIISSGADIVPNSLVINEMYFGPPHGCGLMQREADRMASTGMNYVRERAPTCARCALMLLHGAWEMPDGQLVTDAPAIWRHERELSLGFYYRWTEQPPKPWMDARREWASLCRQTLKNNRRGLDTEAQLAAAVVRGEYPGAVQGAYEAWKKVRDSFEPKTEAVWITDKVLQTVGWFAKKQTAPLLWVEHRAVGNKLSQLFGWPYHADMGKSKDGKFLEDRTPSDGPLILSTASCSTGRNLQAWCENIVVTSPASGSTYEQLLGRTHRDGQEADEVVCDIIFTSDQSYGDFWQAVADAQYVEATTGAPQKLSVATINVNPATKVS